MTRAEKAIGALRDPHYTLARVPNTVRQSIADVIEEQKRQIDRYGLALMMIREGCGNAPFVAGKALRESAEAPQ